MISSIAFATLEKTIWPKWQVHNPLSQAIIAHDEWQLFLSQHVIINQEGINLVDYPHVTDNEIKSLEKYLARMSKIRISHYNRHEQLAFWINLYNALTVVAVAHNYPLVSIRDINITPGLFSTGPWGAPLFTIDGAHLSLDDIYHHIIRPIWNDPRTHYALNNATMGAANIQPNAFQGSIIDMQLNDAAFAYINSLRGAHVIGGKLIVSKLYAWFIDDFGGSEADLIRHFSQFAYAPLRNKLQHIKTINKYLYNWHLNTTIGLS